MTERGPKEEEEGGAPWAKVYPSTATRKQMKEEEGGPPWAESVPDTRKIKGEDATPPAQRSKRSRTKHEEGVKPEPTEDDVMRKAVVAVQKARASQRRQRPDDRPDHEPPLAVAMREEPRPSIAMRNYAAVGVGDTASDEAYPAPLATALRNSYYGLIDLGPGPRGSGTRCLIMHSPPLKQASSREGQTPTDRVRPGAMLRVLSTEEGGGSARLRVRFTTPDKYYAPGARVTTLRIGVDATDWESLTPKQGRII